MYYTNYYTFLVFLTSCAMEWNLSVYSGVQDGDCLLPRSLILYREHLFGALSSVMLVDRSSCCEQCHSGSRPTKVMANVWNTAATWNIVTMTKKRFWNRPNSPAFLKVSSRVIWIKPSLDSSSLLVTLERLIIITGSMGLPVENNKQKNNKNVFQL